MSKRIIIIVVVLVLLITAAVISYSFIGKKTPSATTTPSTTPTTGSTKPPVATPAANSILSADPAAQADSSKKRFAAAQEKLISWSAYKSNAVFSGLFMTFDSKLTLNSANEVYVFDSPDDTTNHYTVSVAQLSGNMLRAIIPVSDYQGALKPIKQEFWATNYVDALQTTDKNGGQTFMLANQVTTVDVKLLRADPKDFLYWVVTYHTKDATKVLTVKIDAKEKTVVKE